MKAVALCVLCLVGVRFTAASAPSLRPTYAALLPQLRASGVPLLLPATLPQALGKVRSVAVISAGPSGYYVGFSPVTHCAGGLSCAFFHVAGYPASSRTERTGARSRPVRFPDGTHAIFGPRDCSGASCTEASLIFERRGSVYELDAKVPCDDLAALADAYRNVTYVR